MQSFPKQKKKKRAKKKEPERPSIMHSRESGTCYLCMKLHNDYRRHPALQEHHIFGGCPNRTHSGHYGLKVSDSDTLQKCASPGRDRAGGSTFKPKGHGYAA